MSFFGIKNATKEHVIELLQDTSAPKLSDYDRAKAWDVIKVINESRMEFTPGWYISKELRDNTSNIRHIIQKIRCHNDQLLSNNYYLIATNKGYKITDNKDEILTFFNKTQIRYQNTTAQLLQMILIVG